MKQNPLDHISSKVVISLLIILFSNTVPFFIQKAQASGGDGIIIHAKRIEGNIFIPSVANGETAHTSNQLMLRFNFDHATIYHMTISKQITTSKKSMVVHIASPKVTANNLQVDVTSFSFQGACLQLDHLNHMVVLKNVTLIAHQSRAGTMALNQTKININYGSLKPPTEHMQPVTNSLSSLLCTLDAQSITKQSLLKNPLNDTQLNHPVASITKKATTIVHQALSPIKGVNHVLNNDITKPLENKKTTAEKDVQALVDQQTKDMNQLYQQAQQIQDNINRLKNKIQATTPLLLGLHASDYLAKLNDYSNQLKQIDKKKNDLISKMPTTSSKSGSANTQSWNESVKKLNHISDLSKNLIQNLIQTYL